METEILDYKQDLKHDCMWSVICDSKSYKMDSFSSKSPFSSDLNEMYFNYYGNQNFPTLASDSIDLLDSLDSEDFNDSEFLSYSNNQNLNCLNDNSIGSNNHQINSSNLLSLNQNYQSSNLVNTNQINTNKSLNHNISTSSNLIATNKTDSSSILGSSLSNDKTANVYFNDLLLSSNSANIILNQHNQVIDSQNNLGNHNLNSNQNNYSSRTNCMVNNLDDHDNPCDTGLVVSSLNSEDCTMSKNQINLNTQSLPNYNNYILNQNSLMSTYPFELSNQLMDSTFCVSESSASSNNSECSSSVLLERTDYDTDDIEDDLDLLEDIIEEEIDDFSGSRRKTCRSIANSLESSSDVDMIASPISDSLINDHSYGAISNDNLNQLCISQNSTNSSITNHLQNNNQNEVNKANKRRCLTNNTSANQKKNLQRHSGTSLLMKDKQIKMKKVMDTDRRKEHNESERMRRDVLKNAFLLLRNKCPKLQNSAKKSSRIQILNEATSYIKQMNEKGRYLENIKQQELQRKLALINKLKSLGGN